MVLVPTNPLMVVAWVKKEEGCESVGTSTSGLDLGTYFAMAWSKLLSISSSESEFQQFGSVWTLSQMLHVVLRDVVLSKALRKRYRM